MRGRNITLIDHHGKPKDQPFLTVLRPILTPAILLTAVYFFYFRIYQNYFPFGDDPSVFRASAGSPIAWFTEGFSKYFIVYPEWTIPFTDFMRPGVNLIIRLNQMLFGQHYAFYFAAFYLAQFLLCTLSILIARRLGIQSRWLYLIGLLVAINPAFMGDGLSSAVFHFDIWCGLFALFALYLILREYYVFAIVSLTFAVFTKEAALYAPIAAAITVYLSTRKKLLSTCMLLPLVIWLCVWKFIFVGTPKGIYALSGSNPRALFGSLSRGLLIWPTGVFDHHAIRGVAIEHSIIPDLGNLLIALINLILWCLLFSIAIRMIRTYLSRERSPYNDASVLSLLVWLCGALSFGVLVGQEPRFGGSIYPLELVFCAVILHKSTRPATQRLVKLALILIAISFLWNAQATLRRRDSSLADSMKSLVSAIHRQKVDVVYVLNSVDAFSAPSDIAKFADTSSEVVILNQVKGCLKTDAANPPSLHLSGEVVRVVSILPPCAEYKFEGASSQILARAFNGALNRDHFAVYHLPNGRVTEYGLVNPNLISSIDMGKELDIELTPKITESYVILYYDWSNGEYRCAGDKCG